jgi:hypothetical protein
VRSRREREVVTAVIGMVVLVMRRIMTLPYADGEKEVDG